jgi:farnesyl diphosphate synthase
MAASSHVSRANFEAVFPTLVEDISQAAKQYNIPTNALEWLQKVNHLEKLY